MQCWCAVVCPQVFAIGNLYEYRSWLSENKAFNLCWNLWGIPVPTAHTLPKPAGVITVKRESAWVSCGKLMKPVWEDPRLWVQVFACLHYFLSAKQAKEVPILYVTPPTRAHMVVLVCMERQRSEQQGGWKENGAVSKGVVPYTICDAAGCCTLHRAAARWRASIFMWTGTQKQCTPQGIPEAGKHPPNK